MQEVGYSKVVAIDGPSGSGKSTVARKLALEMNLLYVDTGAMFRALALHFHHEKLSWEEDEAAFDKRLKEKLAHLSFRYGESAQNLVEVNGRNLTQEIRGHFVSELASKISKVPAVRQFLQEVQRKLVSSKVCVMEGRDIGTVIFPRSFCKIFLTASLEVRAQRRFKELEANGEKNLTLGSVMDDVKQRDDRDINRVVAPLRPAPDAIILDSTNMNLQEVTASIEKLVRGKAHLIGWVVEA